jgi:hypothetical protein
VAHLGSGASMAAIRHGESIDTSMGLTPCGGLPMGSRSGDLDPGVLIHLLRQHHYTVDSLEDLLNHGSGLKGLAGTGEMSELLSRAGNVDANALAVVELFAYSIKKQLGAYFAVLGGLDCLQRPRCVGYRARSPAERQERRAHRPCRHQLRRPHRSDRRRSGDRPSHTQHGARAQGLSQAGCCFAYRCVTTLAVMQRKHGAAGAILAIARTDCARRGSPGMIRCAR